MLTSFRRRRFRDDLGNRKSRCLLSCFFSRCVFRIRCLRKMVPVISWNKGEEYVHVFSCVAIKIARVVHGICYLDAFSESVDLPS